MDKRAAKVAFLEVQNRPLPDLNDPDVQAEILLGNEYTEIIPQLFLGGDYNPQKIAYLNGTIESTAPRFGFVVRCSEEPSKCADVSGVPIFAFEPREDSEGRLCVGIHCFDLEAKSDLLKLKDCCIRIKARLEQHCNVLVHCQQGVDCSATVVAAFCMAYFDISTTDASESLKTLRPACTEQVPGYEELLRTNEGRIRRFFDSIQKLEKKPSPVFQQNFVFEKSGGAPPWSTLERSKICEVAEGVVGAIDPRYGGVVKRLRSRLRDYESRVELAKKLHAQRPESRRGLEEKIRDLQSEVESLRVEVASAGQAAGRGRQLILNLGNLLGKGRQSEGAVRRRHAKEGAARFGMDVLHLAKSQTNGSTLLESSQKVSRLTANGLLKRLRLRLLALISGLIPLEHDVFMIGQRYGPACEHFFRFHRFLYLQSCICLICFLPLPAPMLLQTIDKMASGTAPDLCGPWYLPCGALLSGLTNNSDKTITAATYAITTSAAALVLLVISVMRWADCDFIRLEEELDTKICPRVWSKLTLVAWDFRLGGADGRQWRDDLAARLTTELAEETVESEAQTGALHRTGSGRFAVAGRDRRSLHTGLFAASALRRRCAIVVQQRLFAPLLCLVLLVFVPLLVVVSVSANTVHVGEFVTKLLGGGPIGRTLGGQGKLLPNFGAAAVGIVLPPFAHLVSRLGARSPTAQTQLRIWLLLLGRMCVALPLVAVNISVALNLSGGSSLRIFDRSQWRWTFDTGFLFGVIAINGPIPPRELADYPCAEDQAATNLASLAFTELLLNIFAGPPLANLLGWLRYRFIEDKADLEPFVRPQFDIVTSAVDAVYLHFILNAASLLIPGMALLAPALLLLHFKWLRFVLGNLSRRPFIADIYDLGATLLQALCVSSLMFGAVVGAILSGFSFPASSVRCGPFAAGVTPNAALLDLQLPGVETAVWLNSTIESNRISVYFAAAAASVAASVLLSNRAKAYEDGLWQLKSAARRQVDALKGDLRRMERQNTRLRTLVQWHDKHGDLI